MEATLAVVSAILTVCVVSEFTPVVYEITSTSQCDQQIQFDYDQRLMNSLKIVHQQLPLQDATLLEHVEIFFAATHLPPQATTRSRLPMDQLCRSTVTWRGLTVEEREAG